MEARFSPEHKQKIHYSSSPGPQHNWEDSVALIKKSAVLGVRGSRRKGLLVADLVVSVKRSPPAHVLPASAVLTYKKVTVQVA